MRRDVMNSCGTRPPIPPHLGPEQSAFAILVMQLWLLMSRASINESINTAHFVAPTLLDSIAVIVIRRERLHGFHKIKILLDGSPG